MRDARCFKRNPTGTPTHSPDGLRRAIAASDGTLRPSIRDVRTGRTLPAKVVLDMLERHGP